MTKYVIYIKEYYCGYISVQSYLSEAEIINLAINRLGRGALKVNQDKIHLLSNGGISYGEVSLIAACH